LSTRPDPVDAPLPTSPSPRLSRTAPCVVHEDEDLLVVAKPAGWNTHAPAPYAGEGIYDWLRHREPRWAGLSILHRLDKETSGVLVFGKSDRANRSLTEQFTRREVQKTYCCHGLPGSGVRPDPSVRVETRLGGVLRVTSWIERDGESYRNRPSGPAGEEAVTEFRPFPGEPGGERWEAHPETGRTHQIRVHAAALGRPILGDVRYGGSPAGRVWLQAWKIGFRHPATGDPVEYSVPCEQPGPGGEAGTGVWEAMVDPTETDAFRWLHGAASGCPGVSVERLGRQLLIQSTGPTPSLEARRRPFGFRESGVYLKALRRDVRQTGTTETSPVRISGEAAGEAFPVRENGVGYEVSFGEGYSYGLFLDQRDNRRRLLTGHVAAGFPLFPEGAAGKEVLNAFAYTCAFSVCAALGGARTTSLDLSRKYLEWGRRNFLLNGLDPAAHDFIYGDCFDWLRRLGKKGRRFDGVLLDPPTFSRSKEHGDFRAELDYGLLVEGALRLLAPGGVLFASTNAARLGAPEFLAQVAGAVGKLGRRITAQHYVPQPPDFPITRDEPAYLKTVWLRVG
jgi:23S rRNA (cytosine1962-C5)-methyltransferase